MNGWQPIETAPKDGTRLLTYCASTSFPHQRYDLMFYANRWRPLYGGMANHPTHWMPLPSPPDSERTTNEVIAVDPDDGA